MGMSLPMLIYGDGVLTGLYQAQHHDPELHIGLRWAIILHIFILHSCTYAEN